MFAFKLMMFILLGGNYSRVMNTSIYCIITRREPVKCNIMENDLLQIKKNLSALYAYYIIEGGRIVKCEIGYGEKGNFYLQLSIAFPEFLVHQ